MYRRWYRDPSLPIHRTEITRFPHAVLEIKLSLAEGEAPPDWVAELVDSGGRLRGAGLLGAEKQGQHACAAGCECECGLGSLRADPTQVSLLPHKRGLSGECWVWGHTRGRLP
jgi:hypothetical protein